MCLSVCVGEGEGELKTKVWRWVVWLWRAVAKVGKLLDCTAKNLQLMSDD